MKILIAEDTENSRILLEDLLSGVGYTVRSASDGLDAIEKIEDFTPDLIISDILMPRMDGFEFCRRIKQKEKYRFTPFIFYTATYTDEKDRQFALSLGADRFVIKPQLPDNLLEIIQEVVSTAEKSQPTELTDKEFTTIHGDLVSSKLEKKIHELKIEHDLLNRKERELRLVTDAIPILVSHVDKESRYCYVNRAYEDWHQLKKEDIVGKKISDVVGEAAWQIIAPKVKKALAGEPVEYESELKFSSGNNKIVLAKYVPITDSSGRADGFIALVTDITEQVNEQNEKQRLYEQFLQSQKMESIGHLVGGIAHDFNNMLASMIGFAELTKEMLPDSSKEAGYLSEVLDTGKKARDLVAQMLAFGRGGHHDVETVMLASSIDSAMRLIRKLLPSSIDIHTNLAEQDYAIDINTVQFQQVLMNLCINARDAMHGHGTITIASRKVDVNSENCSSCHNAFSGSYVVVTVKDSGSGLAQDTLSKIFEPFFSTKEVGQGSGMGLSVVHGVMHSVGGHIKVHSGLGEGMEFELFFPESELVATDDMDQTSMELELKSVKQHGRILVLDDEKSVGLYLEILLVNAGHKVKIFNNPVQAIEHLEQVGCHYDLILTDYTMPTINGVEFANKARQVCGKPIPIILCTGYSESIDKNTAMQNDFSDYFTKPFSSRSLLDSIQRSLGESDRK